MQLNDDYIEELFACKLGNMEVLPPEDVWIRIESELNRVKRMSRKYWLAAASFALLLSATASVLYIQTNFTNDRNTNSIAAIEDIARRPEEMTTIVEEKPAIVEEKPAIVEEKPAIVEEKSVIVEEKPVIVEETPAIVGEKPVPFIE